MAKGDPTFQGGVSPRVFSRPSVGSPPHVMVKNHRSPEPQLVSQRNSLSSQFPGPVPVTQPAQNESQTSFEEDRLHLLMNSRLSRRGLGSLSDTCEKCGRPGEVFYYQGVEVTLCGDCLVHLEAIVNEKKRVTNHM